MQKALQEPRDQYTQHHQFKANLAGQEVIICSKPGIAEWDTIPHSARLLAEYAEIEAGWQVLQIGCGNGAWSVILGRKSYPGIVYAWDANYVTHQCTLQTVAANAVNNVSLFTGVNLDSELHGNFDAAVMLAPKGRTFGQRCLAMAYQALRSDGTFYLAGPKHGGVQPLIKDAEELFGAGVILAYKKGNRVVRFIKNGQLREFPAWAKQPGIAPNTWKKVSITLSNKKITIETLPGIFSYDGLDDGSSFLLEQKIDLQEARVLDLGCGWGAIGLWASVEAAQVDMVDSNMLGVAASSRNILMHRVANAQALASDVTSAVVNEKYSHVLTNPPFHIGREVDYSTPLAFIQQSASVLVPRGELWLVANKFIPYLKIMPQFFKRTWVAGENSKYQVLVGMK